MGPSRVEPLYGEIFTARYGPSFGIQVWCPDVLTSYVVQVPKMVCFFEVAFENGLRFPLQPFIKRVLHHFNVYLSQHFNGGSALERACQEALEAGNSVECLMEELNRLRMDHARQKALASRRGKVIAELKDEACTQWASGWLAFQRRASRAFPDLEFNIQLSDEEVERSASEAEVDAGAEVFSGALDRAPLPGDSRFLRGLALLLRLLGLRLLTPLLLQVGAQRQAFRLFFFFFLPYLDEEPGFLYCL